MGSPEIVQFKKWTESIEAGPAPNAAIVIAAATTFHKAKEIGKAADLKAGVRVVVNVGAGKEPLTAKDIQYAAPPTTTSKS